MPIEKLQNHLIFELKKLTLLTKFLHEIKGWLGWSGVTANWAHLASSSLAYVACYEASISHFVLGNCAQ
jgi:hypothetical protein